jgi:hypothetical protein
LLDGLATRQQFYLTTAISRRAAADGEVGRIPIDGISDDNDGTLVSLLFVVFIATIMGSTLILTDDISDDGGAK